MPFHKTRPNSQQLKHPIKIYTVPQNVYQQIEDLELIPFPHLRGSLISSPALEDYILTPEYSLVAKEFEELEDVKKYILENNLSEIDVSIHSPLAKKQLTTSPDETLQQKASKARHEPTNQLKRDCVSFWLEHNKLSQAEAARRFYKELPAERKKLLAETNADKTLAKALSEYA